jgi:hypothetical protein
MRTFVTVVLLVLTASLASAQARSPYLEDYTWPELKALIDGGTTTAVIVAGGIEQNGPHMALVKHNLIARHLGGQIASRLGNALAYPVIPFSMAGDPIEKNNHMRLPGTISLPSCCSATTAADRTSSVSWRRTWTPTGAVRGCACSTCRTPGRPRKSTPT